MHDFSSTSEVSQACPRAAARLLREWLPGWSGSIVLHGTAVCCFVAASEYGPQLWPVTRGRSSIASAPAMDSRAGGLLAKMVEQAPPMRVEILDAPDVSAADDRQADSRTVLEVAQVASRDEIGLHVTVPASERTNVPPRLKVPEDQPLTVRVDPGSIRDEELLRSLNPTVETKAPAESESDNGSSASQGNAAEDSVASTASAASNGAEDNQLPQPAATNVAPPYPEEARTAGVQGKVTLRLRIGVDGRVESLKILTSSGAPSLDESALTAVKQWRFEPARRLGKPVAMDVKTSVSFQIEAE